MKKSCSDMPVNFIYRAFLIVSIVFQFAVITPGCSYEPEYETTWQTGYNPTLRTVLKNNNIHDCKYLKYKNDIKQSGRFLVYCSSEDAKKWTAYEVYPALNSVIGPIKKDPKND